MLESYKVGISLILETNTAAEVSALAKAMRDLDQAAKDAQGSMRGLADAAASFARVGPGINAAAEAMERYSRAAQTAASAMAGAAGGFGGAGGAGPTMAPAGGAQPSSAGLAAPAGGGLMPLGTGGGGGRGPIPLVPIPVPGANPPGPRPMGTGDLMLAATGYGLLGGALGSGLSDIFEVGAKMEAERRKMAANGFTKEQIAAAEKASYDVQNMGIPVGPVGAMEAQFDIFRVIRDPAKAATLLPDMLRMATVEAQMGHTDGLTSLNNMIRSGELKGAIHSDEELKSLVNLITASSVTSGGLVGSKEILQILRSGGPGARLLQDQQLLGEMLPIIMGMGPQRAGTGLRAFMQQMIVGQMSEHGGEFLADLGVVKRDHLKKYGLGYMQVTPGGFNGDAEKQLRDGDWMGFIHGTLMPSVHKYNMEHYGHDTAEDQISTMSRLSSRLPEASFLAEYVSLMPLLPQYRKAVTEAGNRDLYGTFANDNPNFATAGLRAATEGFLASLANKETMDAAVSALHGLADALNTLSAWARSDTGTAAILTRLAVALTAFSVAVSGIAFSLALAMPMINLIRGAPLGAGLVPGGAAAGSGVGAMIGGAIGTSLALGSMYFGMQHYADKGMRAAAGDSTTDAVYKEAQSSWKHWLHYMPGLSMLPFGVGGFDPHPSAAPPIVVQSPPVTVRGELTLNGAAIGSFVAKGIADRLQSPTSGPTHYEPRTGPLSPGQPAQ